MAMSDRMSIDTALIDRARAGDEAAFRGLVERYESQVAATVVGMLGPGDEADDVGQETFVRFYQALSKFRGEAALGTYLTRIAMNLSLNAIKRRQRQRWRHGADLHNWCSNGVRAGPTVRRAERPAPSM